MHRRLTLFATLMATSLTAAATAQPSSPTPSPGDKPAAPAATEPPASLAAAETAFREEDWPAAVEHYQAAQREGMNHPVMHFRLGYALHMLKRYDEALPHHRRAVRVANPALRIDALYNTACALALTGDKPGALEYLAKARDAGFADATQLNSDTDLNSLRSYAAFKALSDDLAAESPSGLFQQLDVLLGSWQVTEAPADAPADAPRRTITFARPLAGSHAVVTTSAWPAPSGQPNPNRDRTGLMHPDADKRDWVWTVADGLGNTIILRGSPIRGGGLRFVGQEFNAAGPSIHLRWTFTPDAALLRETIESSEDGQTWKEDVSRTLSRLPSAK